MEELILLKFSCLQHLYPAQMELFAEGSHPCAGSAPAGEAEFANSDAVNALQTMDSPLRGSQTKVCKTDRYQESRELQTLLLLDKHNTKYQSINAQSINKKSLQPSSFNIRDGLPLMPPSFFAQLQASLATASS
jgi:hypothetical protein